MTLKSGKQPKKEANAIKSIAKVSVKSRSKSIKVTFSTVAWNGVSRVEIQEENSLPVVNFLG